MSQASQTLLNHYMRQIQAFDPLTFEEEQDLAKRWRHKQDRAAFHHLMESYLRLVVKVAVSFRGYGLPLEEMIQEGNIGLMQAIARFEPERGFRLSTYAMWWIRASIQEYILNNWSLVKIGTNSVQKKLFFSLRKLRNQLQTAELEYLSDDTIQTIAEELGVKEADVRRMEQRLSGVDNSLNNMIGGSEEDGDEWQDWLVEDRPNQEEIYADKQQTYERRHSLNEALDILDERERMIFISRRLNEPEQVPTLEDLSQKLGISRERVRQLEVRAFSKVQNHMQEAAD
jgi:RNA polymerase sigma-32 factor